MAFPTLTASALPVRRSCHHEAPTLDPTTPAPPTSTVRPVKQPPAETFGIGPVRTVANAVTLGRTVAAVVIAGVGIATGQIALLGVAYAVYWIGDIADGWFARRLGQETRLGAVFDIISDRACTSILCVGLIAEIPGIVTVAVAFFLSFMVLDTMLSLSFLCWPLLSPNYFDQADRLVYKLNWSPPAKAINTAGVIVLALVGLTPAALLLTAALGAIKVWSGLRVLRLLGEVAR